MEIYIYTEIKDILDKNKGIKIELVEIDKNIYRYFIYLEDKDLSSVNEDCKLIEGKNVVKLEEIYSI